MLKSVGSQPQNSEEEEQHNLEFLNEQIILYPEVRPKDSKDLILKELSIKLDRCMERHKLYLDPKINLGRVANIVGSNRTYISNIMTEKNGFRNYLNELRLRHMAQKLRKEQIRVKKRNDHIKTVARQYPKADEDITILLSEPEDKIPPVRLTALITSCGFIDMRAFRRALFQSKSDYAEEIKGYIY